MSETFSQVRAFHSAGEILKKEPCVMLPFVRYCCCITRHDTSGLALTKAKRRIESVRFILDYSNVARIDIVLASPTLQPNKRNEPCTPTMVLHPVGLFVGDNLILARSVGKVIKILKPSARAADEVRLAIAYFEILQALLGALEYLRTSNCNDTSGTMQTSVRDRGQVARFAELQSKVHRSLERRRAEIQRELNSENGFDQQKRGTCFDGAGV